MEITTTKADGTVTHQTVDVRAAATIGSMLRNVEHDLRTGLIASGIDRATANEIAIAAHEGGRAAAVAAGYIPTGG